MKAEIEFPSTLQEAIKFFANEQVAFNFMKGIRWPTGTISCPRCGGTEASFISTRKLWACKGCKVKKQFTIRVGTILEDSPIGFDKWICAFWLIANAENGVSSYEVGRALGVTQRTGWFMLQRIRLAMQTGTIVKSKLTGTVEVDESYIGSAARFKHKHLRQKKLNGTGLYDKTAVQGFLQKDEHKGHSKVITEVILRTKRETLQKNVRKYVLKGSEVHTDAHPGYDGLSADFVRKVVDHVECYVKDGVHTNGLESFWNLLKRTIKGTYVSVEPSHLFRHMDEQAFQFNERKDDDQGRFLKAIAGMIGKRLTWVKLVGGEEALPAQA